MTTHHRAVEAGQPARQSSATPWLHLEQSITIARPVSAVFAYAGAYENDPAWRSGVVEMVQDPAGIPTVGATTREVLRVFGRRQVTVAEVVAYEPDRRTAFVSLGGSTPVRGSRHFEACAAGTRFSYELELARTGLVRLLGPVLVRSLNRDLARSLRRLKGLLDDGREHSPTSGGLRRVASPR